MYKLFQRAEGGLTCVVRCMSLHLRECGRGIVTDEPGAENPGRNAISYIQSLLDLHDQYMILLEQSFKNDQLFKHAIQSVSTFISVCVCVRACTMILSINCIILRLLIWLILCIRCCSVNKHVSISTVRVGF